MDLHDKAEKLHQLGHEVAAAALRRSEMLPDAWRIFRVHPTAGPNQNIFQPGATEGPKGRHYALRVGNTIGPITRTEYFSVRPQGHGIMQYAEHPLASGGHGLHIDDPAASSFAFLKQHLDNPHVWPIVADHFEENGGRRALAMARILREPVEPYDTAREGYRAQRGNLKSPVAWPIPVHWDAQRNTFGLRLGNWHIKPAEDAESQKRGWTRNLDGMANGLR